MDTGYVDEEGRILNVSTHAEPEQFLRLTDPSGHNHPRRRVRIALEHYLRRTNIDYQVVISSSEEYVIFKVSKISDDRFAVSQKTGYMKQYLLFGEESKVKDQIEGIGRYCLSGENSFLRLDRDRLNWGKIVR